MFACRRRDLADSAAYRYSIAPPPGAESYRTPNHGGLALSPDGRALAFVAIRDGQSRIWLQAVDSLVGRGVTSRIATGLAGRNVSWSPDNTRIAFARGKEIVVINASGSPEASFGAEADGNQVAGWAPDGRAVLYFERGSKSRHRLCTVHGA